MMPYDEMIFTVLKPQGAIDEQATEVPCLCIKCKRPKMYVNRQSGVAFCFHCEFACSARGVLQAALGLSSAEAKEEIRAYQHLHHITPVKSPDGAAAEGPGLAVRALLARRLLGASLQTAKVPRSTVPMPFHAVKIDGTRGEKYLQWRGFTPAHYAPYRLGFCPASENSNRYADHVIFYEYLGPHGHPVFWTTRATQKNHQGPKSYSAPGVTKQGLLFGLFAIPSHAKTVFVVEGPLDAIALSGSAVALLGKTANAGQIAELARRFSRVIVCLDATASLETLRVAAQLKAARVERCLYAVLPPEMKDPGELARAGHTPKAAIRYVLDHTVEYTPSAVLKTRLQGDHA